jgi:hypothetical protein
MAKDPKASLKPLPITINANYLCVPPAGRVNNGGQVNFIVAPNDGCFVYTDPAEAFVGETNGCLPLKKGSNICTTYVLDTNICYCACATGTRCTPLCIKSGGYTIKVGNPPLKRHRK